ncbi:type IV toxin-antitoxin system AbiEi family antitoxin domain-containing protein [Baekduia sp.]|jgi:predicted transcriptional regulator of viral defense system|uniref:type IV toxin-antitoxin system AbiEi family antitoxin domain-containing protein n=1 Tax=Baekduia sp. TaxID=2600305 RepID=UPI002E0C95A7|nr:type IV toxin-antitoxin system AbiEi family antitoxin domain-containing protein [Baekduia sp.]
MPGKRYNEIFELAAEQYGYVTTGDAREMGIDIRRLSDLKARGQADHPAVGLYRIRAIPPTRWDPYMAAALWHHGAGVISHETALDLYDVSDVNPAKIHITIPRTPRLTRVPPPAYVVHREALDPRDVTRIESVPIVTLEKAIRQCVASKLRPDLLRQAVDSGRRTGKLRSGQVEALLAEFAPAG